MDDMKRNNKVELAALIMAIIETFIAVVTYIRAFNSSDTYLVMKFIVVQN